MSEIILALTMMGLTTILLFYLQMIMRKLDEINNKLDGKREQ